jgi:zinc transport system substrate-binding protein
MKHETNRLLLVSLTILILSTFPMAACRSASDGNEEGVLQVTVSILPQAYFVERIGGDLVTVNVMVGPGEEAHTYEPTPEQMKSLSDSRTFYTIGVEYETTWVPRFEDINPDLLVVDSAAGIERIPMTDSHAHDDDDTGDHAEGLDPHVWLSPENGKIIAENILDALQILDPDSEDVFQGSYNDLIADIDELDRQIASLFADVPQHTFMVFHPAWGYFANQYGLEQIAVQVGGQDPSVSEMAELIEIALKENIQVIFIQPTFNASDAQAVADEVGAEVVVVDPLARDWLNNLKAVAEAFAAALEE